MTNFQDGPAKGQVLMLHRVARYLRVTQEGQGWDGLDQPGDCPRATEKLHAYELVELTGHAHVNMGHGRGGFYPMAVYRYVPNQPADGQMRDLAAWSAWAELTWSSDRPNAAIPHHVPLV